MAETLKISIITATYNREDTLGDVFKCLRTQTYSHIEHVIIDGVSTDRTLDIINEHFSGQGVVVSEPDNGIYDALNKGVERATGDVIGLLHSDDILADDKVLARIATAFEDPTVDAVYGDLQYVTQGELSKLVRHWQAGELTPRQLKMGWMPPHPTFFVRRSVFDTYGLYDTDFKIAADYDFMLRCLKDHQLNVRYIPHVLMKMRLGGESNKSLRKIIQKTREDYRAVKRNNIGGLSVIFFKNFRKVSQFFP